ncbi:MAG TPA: sigma factor-like helix-turn-helix DNA-binding protein [Candidatus Saccharibacteria bacterium]|nr:sigma factor-like helix-turn-helix DNA-binding protein [Candidatus Saccharibacteria bacterium]HRK94401.1 sigma factor-like helix-turn-helix DNA-binding protein [Candidatus Saccharibacteria bacterium]
MEQTNQSDMAGTLKAAVSDILGVIEQDREREIITRRFGLFDRKETLEQIGELLGITRERVRQLEKAILIRLKIASEANKIPSVHEAERNLIRHLSEKGRVARIQDIAADMFGKEATPQQRAHIAFLAELSPNISVVSENDDYFHSIGIKDHADEKKIKSNVEEIVKTIKQHGEPIGIEELHGKLSHEHPDHVRALASTSKKLASLKDQWGLVKWPTVNPKNIRDKIYVILAENGKPMHFSDIAKAIKKSDFKRKDVTTQAIHNELIKDKRFVLIGRGIYALDSWGYSKGTVADIISDVLKKAGEPLHRDEIVKRVLKSRQVKETTILLNLQSKPQFKRVSKATYQLQEA